MYPEAEFFRGSEGKRIPPCFCCMISRCTEAQDLNGLKMVQKKLPAQSFFKVMGDLNFFHILVLIPFSLFSYFV